MVNGFLVAVLRTPPAAGNDNPPADGTPRQIVGKQYRTRFWSD
jgi:hypothetical protein